jgi:hypothetical protein
MSEPSDPSASLQSQSDINRASFLTTELALCLTFSTIAARNHDAGNPASAEQSMVNAEKAYATVDRFLSDPKHSKHLTGEAIKDLRAELGQLRNRLDELAQRFKK